jgi:hypothetical protein
MSMLYSFRWQGYPGTQDRVELSKRAPRDLRRIDHKRSADRST